MRTARCGLLLVWLLLAAGCFTATAPECAVSCGEGGLCPSGLSCAEDGFCHAPGTPLCRCVNCRDAGEPEDAGPPEPVVYRQVCDAGWCRSYPPFLGNLRGFFESGDERVLGADEGVFRWVDGGWTLVLAEPQLTTMTARSVDDVWAFGSGLSRWNGGRVTVTSLPGVPVSAVQARTDVVLLTRDGGVFRAPVPGSWVFMSVPIRLFNPILAASETSTFIADPLTPGLVALLSRSGDQWLSSSVPVGVSPFATPLVRGVALKDALVMSNTDNAFLLRQRSAIALGAMVPVGSRVWTVNQVGQLVDITETGVTALSALSTEARDLLFAGGLLRPGFRPHHGESGLWVSQANQLWRIDSSGALTSFGAVFTQPIAGGHDDGSGTSILAGGSVFDLSAGSATRRADLPRTVRALEVGGGVAVAVADEGVFQRNGPRWQIVLLRSGLDAVATNGDTIAAAGPGVVSLRRDGGWLTAPLTGDGGTLTVSVSAAGDVFVGNGSAVFVFDGGVMESVFSISPQVVVDLASDARGTVALTRSGLLCDVATGVCEIVGTGFQGRLWPLGSRGLGVTNGTPGWVELSATGERKTISAPFVPSALWLTRDGGVAAGTANGSVFESE